jgi:tetratricopeptide (TPR) repeat protein
VPRALEGQFLFMARRYEDSLSHLNEMLKVDPGFPPTRLFHLWASTAVGRLEDALGASDRILASNPVPEGSGLGALPMKGYLLARLGRRQEAEAVLQQIGGRPADRALVLHALGRDDEEIAALRGALAERSLAVTFLGVDPRWDDLREVPAFRDILARANLLEVSDRVRQR